MSVGDLSAAKVKAKLKLACSICTVQRVLKSVDWLSYKKRPAEPALRGGEGTHCAAVDHAGLRAARCVQHGRDCHFYCTPQNRMISSHQVSDRKDPKKRLTVAVACNADGSTKLPLLFIGSSRQPRCFHSKSCVKLGVDYTSAAKAWMNTQLFNCWAAQFNGAMRADDRHVLLLLDNVPSHRVGVPLSNVSVQMLPPNTTAFRQPQDAGIIRQFKAQILKRQNRHALD